MPDREMAGVVAAVILAVFGFLGVLSYANVPPTPAPIAAAAEGNIFEETTTTTLPDGIDQAVFQALEAEGSAWILPTQQAMQQLPPAIVRVLEDHDAVLRVVDGDDG